MRKGSVMVTVMWECGYFGCGDGWNGVDGFDKIAVSLGLNLVESRRWYLKSTAIMQVPTNSIEGIPHSYSL